MKPNTETTPDGIEIYSNKIYALVDEYINSLDDPSFIYNSDVFHGLINKIYLKCFRPSKNDIVKYNSNTLLDTSDILLLDDIWYIYSDLCSRYKQYKTMICFCNMIGISKDTLNSWKRKEYRNTSNLHSDYVKKWLAECESGTIARAANGNVGAIFLAKSLYGYVETAPVQAQPDNALTYSTPDQIAQRHKDAVKPDITELLDDSL